MSNQNLQMDFEKNIKILIQGHSNNDTPVVKYRYSMFNRICAYYLKNGFPKRCSKLEFSLIPSYFREAIYDGISWSNQNERLGHMELLFEIDCMFQNKGKQREELTPTEFKEYVNFSSKALDIALGKAKKPFWYRLKSKFLSFNEVK
jgi:hypothetical protein